MRPIALMVALCTLTAGCGSIESDIGKCSTKARDELKHFLASNEFQKKELESKDQGIFYQCMLASGYKTNPEWTAYSDKLVRGNLEFEANAFPDRAGEIMDKYLGKINAMNAQVMRDTRPDLPHPPYWIK
jgi:hypothetical protein